MSHNGFPMDGHWVHIILSRDGWFRNNAVKENNCYSCMVNCIEDVSSPFIMGSTQLIEEVLGCFCFSLGCGHSRVMSGHFYDHYSYFSVPCTYLVHCFTSNH
jgi:hypothetical protein